MSIEKQAKEPVLVVKNAVQCTLCDSGADLYKGNGGGHYWCSKCGAYSAQGTGSPCFFDMRDNTSQ